MHTNDYCQAIVVCVLLQELYFIGTIVSLVV